ncbi:hypothetical protein ACIPMZ_03660 [Scandinavium goeteborgense]|uniref:hypothetical protein n=1 Tax=Scandinavium goeteborgense TaxID=1851514 RepID=UPI00380EE857
MIDNFRVTDNLAGYDKINNPQRLSVFDLLSRGVTWSYLNKQYEINDSKGVISLLLTGHNEIALIKAPFDMDANRAWIISADGTVKWDVSNIVKKNCSNTVFYDVYYIDGELYFFIHINNDDFRFSFDVTSGDMGVLLQSR